MSQGAMAIVIDNFKEGQQLSKVLSSSVFEKILKACLWSSFRIEWGMFKDLKKNFYEILDENNILLNKVLTKKIIKINYQIIKHKRKNYYLVENKVYNINKNKSLGELYGNYLGEKIIEIAKIIENKDDISKNKETIYTKL